jgi:hypothetical protein
MKTLLSGNYAVAQFENIFENGFRNMRLHIYRKNEQEWVYESFITLKVHTTGPVQILAFSLSGSKATITAETNTGIEIFEYHQINGGQWRIAHTSHQFKPGYGGQYQRFQKWSKQSLQKVRSYMRVPMPSLAGV